MSKKSDTPAKDDADALMIDGVSYNLQDLGDNARAALVSLQYCDNMLRRIQNEMAVADTARLAYKASLKKQISEKSA